MKLLLYCTKAKPVLKVCTSDCSDYVYEGNGKIVAECDYECEPIFVHETDVGCGFDYYYYLDDDSKFKDLEGSCLTQFDMKNYLGTDASGEKVGYAIHIKNLHIFDEPKKLRDYCVLIPITKAPQNMQYVYDVKKPNEKNVLISIRPEWLCKILNREKTIEVRRKVLKEMLK